MTSTPRLLVFSDLDGTLLDHKTYSWQAAAPALARLKESGAGLILATSKTSAEVEPLRNALGFTEWPAIVENGAGLLESGSDTQTDTKTYGQLRSALQDLPAGFRGFGDMTTDEIGSLTGLSPNAAAKAKRRRFSEPGLWMGDADRFTAFVTAARTKGLTVQRGGRFTTLSFGGNKAERMAELTERFQPKTTIALGDAPNDVQMLIRADHAVVVANRSGPGVPELPDKASGRVIRTTLEGPAGWADAVLELLDDLELTKEPTLHGGFSPKR